MRRVGVWQDSPDCIFSATSDNKVRAILPERWNGFRTYPICAVVCRGHSVHLLCNRAFQRLEVLWADIDDTAETAGIYTAGEYPEAGPRA